MPTSLEPRRTDLDARRLIVTLKISEQGEATVSSCEVLGTDYRNRTSFSSPQKLATVFTPSVAKGVQQCLSTLTKKSSMVSLPDFALEEQGLILANGNVIATETLDHGVSVILRFQTFVGSLAKVFRDHIDLVSGVDEASMKITDKIMFDISMPLLNFLSLDEIGGLLNQEDAQRLLGQLTEKSHELRFQIELIKRHVARIEAQRAFEKKSQTAVTHLDAYVEARQK